MDDFSLRFDIGRTVACIAAGGYTRIALQLPDYMLSDAVRLQQCLQQQLPAQARLYLMADTAFGRSVPGLAFHAVLPTGLRPRTLPTLLFPGCEPSLALSFLFIPCSDF